MKKPPKDVPVIFLTGEIYVRRESLSRQYLTETLAKKGFAVICAPAAEWLIYSDYLVHKGLIESPMSKIEKLKFLLKRKIVSNYEKRIKSILAGSGLVISGPVDVESIVDNAEPYISNRLTGEAVLTVGGSLAEIASNACGVIAIGPFGCMPNRISEAILSTTMERETKLATDPTNKQLRTTLSDIQDLPFLCIESDGSPFPQIIDANLETFCLRSERLNKRMLAARKEEGQGKMHKIKQHASRLFSI
jgi:predicted nucleotide-binding protein (sugar kinase/HSP70/actin superfamily)